MNQEIVITAADVINIILLALAVIGLIVRHNSQVSDMRATLNESVKDVEAMKEEIENFKNKTDIRLDNEKDRIQEILDRHTDQFITSIDRIYTKLNDLEKKIIGENTYLKENLKHITRLITKHDIDIDKLKEDGKIS